eukprot:1175400-Prorocentrum_minimum.AAC.4
MQLNTQRATTVVTLLVELLVAPDARLLGSGCHGRAAKVGEECVSSVQAPGGTTTRIVNYGGGGLSAADDDSAPSDAAVAAGLLALLPTLTAP